MAEAFIMPHSPLLDASGRLRPEWQRYFSGIEKLSKRSDGIELLDPSATLPENVAKTNEFLAANQTTE